MDERIDFRPCILAMDLEGVLVPEIWIEVAAESGIHELRFTTRDIPDYDRLMGNRLRLLREHGISLRDIQAIIRRMEPCDGARRFLDWARSAVPLIILSDTYYEFALSLIEKLGRPALFCNTLEVDSRGRITGYRMRKREGKREAVKAFGELGFRTVAVGDSYNDTTMLAEADLGLLFRPSENVRREFPGFKAFEAFEELRSFLEDFFARSIQ